ncbi:hypothetical protein ACFQ9X_48410 [Catenulispora yoronensis]
MPPDPFRFTEATARAIGLYELDFAVRCARRALDSGGPVEASILLGMALSWLDRGEESEAALAADAARARTDEQIMTMAFTRAANLNWVAVRPQEADLVLREAREQLSSAADRAVLDAFAAVFAVQRGHLEEGWAMLDRLPAAPADWPPVATVIAEIAATDALGVQGRVDEVAEHVERGHAGVDLAPQFGVMRHGLGMGHINALAWAGLLGAADDVADFYAGYTDASAQLSGTMLMHGHYATTLFRSRLALERGRVRTALRLGRDAAAGFAEEDPGAWAVMAAFVLSQAAAAAGDADGAAAAFADAERLYRPTTQGLQAPIVLLCRAWLAAANGTPSRARALARDAASLAADLHQWAVEAVALHTAVRFGDRAPAERLAALAQQIDGPRAPLAARHAAAFAAGDVGGLEAVSLDFEQLGAVLIAADASAQAVSIYRGRGDLRGEQTALTRIRHLVELCETPTLPRCARRCGRRR